jgi:hypothetical protein
MHAHDTTEPASFWVSFIGFAIGVFSFVFLFLLGLALRNRFRMG